MTNSDKGPTTTPSQLGRRVEELNATLRDVEPGTLCVRTGASFEPGEAESGAFHLAYWGREISLTYPEFSCYKQGGDELGIMDRAMLAYYFTTSDGTPLTGRWISFSELPDGKFYAQAFQGYSGGELAKVFENDVEGFTRTAVSIGGRNPDSGQPIGDMAFAYQVLPHVRLLVACWLGDEDFPPSYRVLFDAAAGHHLSTDAYAILGSMLTKRLIKAGGDRGSGTGDQGSGTGDRGSETGDVTE
ncbi:MAG: DUF3786 domain-containing protein [Candidatus Promineifilaceae bacterium]